MPVDAKNEECLKKNAKVQPEMVSLQSKRKEKRQNDSNEDSYCHAQQWPSKTSSVSFPRIGGVDRVSLSTSTSAASRSGSRTSVATSGRSTDGAGREEDCGCHS